MRSNYKRLGDYIQEVTLRNAELNVNNLLGININKFFMPSVANVVGTDMSKYKIVKKRQFACNRMHVGRDKRLPVALWDEAEDIIVSPAYNVFEVIDEEVLSPEYLMMWFSRKEFDRNAWFYTDADVRGGLNWNDFCNLELPVPSIEKQREIVKEYKVLQDRISLNNKLIEKLEDTAQSIYKQWFVDFEKVDNKADTTLQNYIETNPTIILKRNQIAPYVEMKELSTKNMSIMGSTEKEFTGGSKFQNNDTLLARITPCLENGKTAYVDILNEGEIGFGSTEFIVMRARQNISPYWVYCLARDENFRAYAISSMVGSSGRQRVHEKYLDDFIIKEIDIKKMKEFHGKVKPIFNMVKLKAKENKRISSILTILLSKLATVEG